MTANLLPASLDKELVISYRTSEAHYDPRGKLAVLEYHERTWRIVYESPSPRGSNSGGEYVSLAGNWWFALEQVGDVQEDGGEDVLFRLRWSNITSTHLAHARLLTAPNGVIEIVTVEDSFYGREPIYVFEDGYLRSVTAFGDIDAITRILTWEDGGLVVSAEIPNPDAATKIVTTADGTRYFTFDSECDWCRFGLFRSRAGEEPYAFGDSNYVRTLEVLPDGNVYVGGTALFVVEGDLLVPADFAPLPDAPFVQISDMAMTSNGEIWAINFAELLHYGHESSTVYELIANSIMIASDDSVWVDGWDGYAEGNCCIYHIKDDVVISYNKDEIEMP